MTSGEISPRFRAVLGALADGSVIPGSKLPRAIGKGRRGSATRSTLDEMRWLRLIARIGDDGEPIALGAYGAKSIGYRITPEGRKLMEEADQEFGSKG